MSEEAIVLDTMLQYMQTVLEQPNSTFGNLPICPFAQSFRLQQRIQFQVYCFNFSDLNGQSGLMQMIDAFKTNPQFDALLVIHPNPQVMTVNALEQFVDQLNQLLEAQSLVAHSGHPEDSFNINGVYTRREPYLNFTVQSPEKLKWASQLLQKTRYYENWSAENLKTVGLPR